MNTSNTVKIMFELLRNELFGDTLSQGLTFNAEELFLLSKNHDIAHLIGDALEKNKIINKESEIYKKFNKEKLLAIFRYEQQEYELTRISSKLREAGINFVVLKGSALRAYYLEPWMRTSADIDILIDKNDINKSIDLLSNNLNYKYNGLGPHDCSFTSESKVHVELHYELIEKGEVLKSDVILARAWDYLKKNKEVFDDEMLYFYHIVHMAKHFKYGGCGVRFFIDLWILNHNVNHNDEKRRELLKEGSLLDFENGVRELSEIWFSKEELIEKEMSILQDYVLSGGLYGNTKNYAEAKQISNNSGYFIKRVFIPFEVLKNRYRILEKHKWLFPLMEIRFWIRCILIGKVRQLKKEMRLNKQIEDSRRKDVKAMMKFLGL